jgi:hypothetical protein
MDTAGVSSESPPARRPGRRSRPAREKYLMVRVSAEEHEAIVQKAASAGLNVSALVRGHLDKLLVRHREDERQRVTALNRINANLNMIAKWVNTYKPEADAVQVMVYLADVARELRRVLEATDRR